MADDKLDTRLARAGALYREGAFGVPQVTEGLKARVLGAIGPRRRRRREGVWWWALAGVFAALLFAAAAPELFAPTRTVPAHVRRPTVIDLLPRSGNYAFADGYVQRWQVRRTGDRLTITECDAGVSAPQPTFIYDLEIEKGCLRQLDVRTTEGNGEAEAFPWYCVPAQHFQDAYDNADYHVVERARESWVRLPGIDQALLVQVRQTQGGSTYTIRRYFAKGIGLVRETIADAYGHVGYDLRPVPGAGGSRPIQAVLQDIPFGANPQTIPFQLFAPVGLPFSTYIPLAQKSFGPGFSSRSIRVGQARGAVFGDLQAGAMLTEFVLLPKGATLPQAVASLKEAEGAYPKLRFTADQNMKYRAYSWAIREYNGTDPTDVTDVGGADIGRYRGQYFYLIRAGWYEQDALPILSAWRWSDGKGLADGAARAR